MSLIHEITDDVNRRVAITEIGLGITTTTVFDPSKEVFEFSIAKPVFVIEEKRVSDGKTLTRAIDSKGMVGGEWIE